MKALKTLVVGLAVIGLLFAVPAAAIALIVTVGHDDQATASRATMPHMSSTGMGGLARSATQTAAVADELTIVHVQKGCHVWANGAEQMATMRLRIKPGQMLRIMNQDLDMHRMMQLSGPAMMLGGPMEPGQARSLTFTKPGTYRLDTKVLPMKGMPEVATTGADNTLKLTVTVT